jgi:hypothetical protein
LYDKRLAVSRKARGRKMFVFRRVNNASGFWKAELRAGLEPMGRIDA